MSVWLLKVQDLSIWEGSFVSSPTQFFYFSISFLFKQKLKDTGLHVNKQLDSYILFKIKAILDQQWVIASGIWGKQGSG